MANFIQITGILRTPFRVGTQKVVAGTVTSVDLDDAGVRRDLSAHKGMWTSVIQPEKVTTVTAAGSAQTLVDPRVSSISDLTLTSASCALTFPTAVAGLSFTLVLRQDATGSRVVTWPASVKWASATAPTLTTSASAVDILSFLSVNGTSWLGFVSGQDVR